MVQNRTVAGRRTDRPTVMAYTALMHSTEQLKLLNQNLSWVIRDFRNAAVFGWFARPQYYMFIHALGINTCYWISLIRQKHW